MELTHLAFFLGTAANARVVEALEKAGFRPKVSHGYVVQQLLLGPRSVSELASALEVTQQAVSKWVAEMAALELLRDAPSDDARVRRVELSARGQASVDASRKARAVLETKLQKALGPRRFAAAQTALEEALEALGELEAVKARRVKPGR
ncbi:MAG: winged helix DNA-binding protein [Archangiaceae bacterium]|nr:winged helix DNA-binding protein [Archangiaceae bacterium]